MFNCGGGKLLPFQGESIIISNHQMPIHFHLLPSHGYVGGLGCVLNLILIAGKVLDYVENIHKTWCTFKHHNRHVMMYMYSIRMDTNLMHA